MIQISDRWEPVTFPISPARQSRFDSDSRRRCERYGAPFEPVSLAAVLAKTGGRCCVCRVVLAPDTYWPDHRVPVSRGGFHTIANLWPMCRVCNQRKAATPPAPDIPPVAVRNTQATLWRLGIDSKLDKRAGRHGVICAPQAWTIVLRIDPLNATRAMAAGDALSLATGAAVTVDRIGARVAVRIPRPRPLGVPLRLMAPARGLLVQIGYDDRGRAAWADLTTHLLAAGATGVGKSQVLRAIVRGLAIGNSPDGLRLALADPSGKMKALREFSRLSHLIAPIAANRADSLALVAAFERELLRRGKSGQHAPPWVLVVDEALDLDNPDALFRLARLGREMGLHVVCAMQAERATNINTQAAAQFGTRLCFRVAPNDGYTSRMVVGDTRATALQHPGHAWVHTPTQLRNVAVAFAPPGDACWSDHRWAAAQSAGGPDPLPVDGRKARQKRAEPGECPPDVARWWIEETEKRGQACGIQRLADRAAVSWRVATRWQADLISRYTPATAAAAGMAG